MNPFFTLIKKRANKICNTLIKNSINLICNMSICVLI